MAITVDYEKKQSVFIAQDAFEFKSNKYHINVSKRDRKFFALLGGVSGIKEWIKRTFSDDVAKEILSKMDSSKIKIVMGLSSDDIPSFGFHSEYNGGDKEKEKTADTLMRSLQEIYTILSNSSVYEADAICENKKKISQLVKVLRDNSNKTELRIYTRSLFGIAGLHEIREMLREKGLDFIRSSVRSKLIKRKYLEVLLKRGVPMIINITEPDFIGPLVDLSFIGML